MSLRVLGTRLFKHGTFIIRSLYRREFNTNTIAEHVKPAKNVAVVPQQISPRNFALRNVGLQVGLHARRLFVDSVLNRVTNSLAAELRKKAAKRMLFGDSGPFLAFVGISLASGTGILTKDDELEGICLEIREAVSKQKWTTTDFTLDSPALETTPLSFNNLELSVPIAKGCSAVVYAARVIPTPQEVASSTQEVATTVQEVTPTSSEASPTSITPKEASPASEEDTVRANVISDGPNLEISAEIKDSMTGFPLAVKMMFNYDVQSSAMAILRAMYRETVPARRYYSPVTISNWEMDLMSRTVHLSPHPNVVAMYSVFTAPVPQLRGATAMYPAALPPRLHPEGSGRNMSLFLVMKRYDCSLASYLFNLACAPAPRTSLLLLSQLLEAVAHIHSAGVAHRDLKTDNILLDLQEHSAPILVLTDFGCCLADKVNGLHLPYNSMEIDKGGNTALMAPEVITQQPGTFSSINYSKSDLWAVGCIAYEIYGAPNPFYCTTESNGVKTTRMRSADYSEEELPPMPEHVHTVVKALVGNLLSRNPKKRLDPSVAASVCQLLLWAPSTWLSSPKMPSSTELLQWLLCLTTKVLCEGRSNMTTRYPQDQGRRTYPEYLLISSFLRRAKLAYVRSALNFIHQNN